MVLNVLPPPKEYTHFAGKIGGRPLDCQFIELFPGSRDLQRDLALWEEEEDEERAARTHAERQSR